MTEETLRSVMSGKSEPAAKLALLQHLAGCEECAAIGRRVAEGEFAALTRHFAEAEAEPAAQFDENARRRRTWIYAIAASIAVAIGLSFLVMRIREPEQKPSIAVRPQPPAQQPSPATTTTTNEIDPEWQRLVERAVEKRALPFPAVLATLSIPGDTPRGRGADAQRVSPAGIVIGEARPRFSWPATGGGTSVVFVFDGEREIAQSAPLRGNEWTPAADLPRGRTLAWQVEVQRDSATGIIPLPPAPPAVFRIITEHEEREIARAKALHGDDPLLLAVLYARSGLRDEALTHLRLAAKKGEAGAAEILKNLDEN